MDKQDYFYWLNSVNYGLIDLNEIKCKDAVIIEGWNVLSSLVYVSP